MRWSGWRDTRLAAGGIFAAMALGAAIVLWMTAHWGVGADSDGLAYLILARQLAAGRGYGYPRLGGGLKPITHFPPGYPLLVAAVHRVTGGSMADAALVVSVVSFAATIALTGWLVYRLTRHAWPAWGAAGWLAVADGMLYIYGWARSETVFIALLLALGVLLWRWEVRPVWTTAFFAGWVAAWMTWTRWVGLAAVGWMAWVMAWVVWRRRGQGWRQVLVAVLAAGVPIGALLAVNRWRVGSATNRRLLWHPPTAAKWQQALRTVGDWLCHACSLSAGKATVAGGLLLMITAVLLALAWRRAAREEGGDVWRAFVARWGGFAVLYFGALVAALTVADAAIPLDKRLLSPLLPVLALLLTAAGWALLRDRPGAVSAAAVLGVVFLIFNLQSDYHDLFDMRWGGVAVRSFRWQQAEIWEAVRALPPDVLVLTNDMEGTIYYTNRPARLLDVPVLADGRLYHYDASRGERTPLPYPDMQAWGQALARSLEGKCVVVVYVTLKQPANPALEQALDVVARFRSGVLLAPPGSEACLRR